MAKSVSRLLQEASELATVLGIKTEELVCFSFCYSASFHVTPTALARVFRMLKVPAKALEVTETEKAVHFGFVARGLKWRAVLLTEEVDEWKRVAFADAHKALTSRQPRIAGAVPARLVQKRLSEA